MAEEGNATFRHCKFVSKIGGDGKMRTPKTFYVDSKGRITLKYCQLSGFICGAFVLGSGSQANFKSCDILDCDSAVVCELNSSVSVLQCELAVNSVATLCLNEKGKIHFQGNTVKPSQFLSSSHFPQPRPSETAVIFTDREPSVLEHDFPEVHIQRFRMPEDRRPETWYRGATRKSREDHAEHLSNVTKVLGPLSFAADDNTCIACCNRSSKNPNLKFKYCERCRKVSYCSKECQLADWRDHKLLCRKD